MDDGGLSVEEIPAYLGVSKGAAYTWVSAIGIPGNRVGRFWKLKRDEVDEWVRAGGASVEADGRGSSR
jgi:excisionase family DNA binding protein